MWDERISVVRAFADAITERDVEAALELCHPEIEFFSLMAQLEASPYRGFAGIRRYFRDIEATWEEWRVEVEQLLSAPDGRVVIVMSTHMRGRGSGLPFAQRVANVWEFKDEKLWRATLHRDPADALRDRSAAAREIAAWSGGAFAFGGVSAVETSALLLEDRASLAVLLETQFAFGEAPLEHVDRGFPTAARPR
jgi:ketosteroid isomerase-like protein